MLDEINYLFLPTMKRPTSDEHRIGCVGSRVRRGQLSTDEAVTVTNSFYNAEVLRGALIPCIRCH